MPRNDSPGSVLNGGKLEGGGGGAAWPVPVLAMWRRRLKFCSPTFKFSTMYVNSLLVCLNPVGILNPVIFYLNSLFQSVAWPH